MNEVKIEQVSLSANGPQVSPLVAGFWRLQHWGMSPQQLCSYVQQLLELGVTTVDHAMVYRSEALFGQALSLMPELRSQLQIVSKCGIRPVGFGELGAQEVNHYDSSAKAIKDSVEASLANLGTDYLDVLLLHRPDFLMDIHEIASAFTQLKHEGKVRHFGVSNFSSAQFSMLKHAWPDLVTNQIEFSPLAHQQLDSGIFEQCTIAGVRPMLWSCLGGGRLMQPQCEREEKVLQAIRSVAHDLGVDALDQVVYAWVSSLPCKPIPIVGTHNIERVSNAVKGCQLTLNREQWYAIWEAANGAPVP